MANSLNKFAIALVSSFSLGLFACSEQATIQSASSDASSVARAEASASPTAVSSASVEDTLSTDTEAAMRFTNAKAILTNSCSSCHSFPGFTREQDFVDYQYIVAGDPTSSSLYKYLKGTGFEAEGLSTMPRSGSISAADVAVIQEWIELMGSESTGTDSSNGSSDASSSENSGDDGGGSSGPSASERRTAALTVFTNHCASCHSSTTQSAASTSHNGGTVKAFSAYTTDNQFVSAGLVSVGSSEDSWIYQSLQSYGSIGSMPKSASALTATEATAIADWIDQMNEP